MSFAIAFIPIYIVACLYLRWQLIWWIKKTEWGAKRTQKPLAVILLVIDMVPIAGALLPEGTIDAILQKFGNVWVALTVAGAMTLLVAHAVKHFIKPITHKKALVVVATVILFTSAYCTYGFVHAQHIYTHYYAVEINKDGTKLIEQQLGAKERYQADGAKITRIALLADLHMGVNSRLSTATKMVDIVNDAKVDYVIGAGDYFTSSYAGLFYAYKYANVLAKMAEHSKGCYFAYGNHDVTEPLFCGFAIKKPSEVVRNEGMERFFATCKWCMLDDSEIDIDGIQCYFRADASKTGDGKNIRKSEEELLKDADCSKPIMVIQHEPDELSILQKNGVDLELSGHTHDGQIWPGNWFTRLKAENAHGYKDVDGMGSIVSSGAGYFGPPMRVGTHSEVVIIDLIQK